MPADIGLDDLPQLTLKAAMAACATTLLASLTPKAAASPYGVRLDVLYNLVTQKKRPIHTSDTVLGAPDSLRLPAWLPPYIKSQINNIFTTYIDYPLIYMFQRTTPITRCRYTYITPKLLLAHLAKTVKSPSVVPGAQELITAIEEATTPTSIIVSDNTSTALMIASGEHLHPAREDTIKQLPSYILTLNLIQLPRSPHHAKVYIFGILDLQTLFREAGYDLPETIVKQYTTIPKTKHKKQTASNFLARFLKL